MPYLPLVNLNRSESVRIGRGPGNVVPTALIPAKQTSPARCAFYADLNQPEVRRDLQRHSAIGAIQNLGSTSLTQTSDFYKVSGTPNTTAGTGFALTVAAGVIRSRTFGDILNFAGGASVLTPAAPPAFGGRTDYVVVNNAGVLSLITGSADTVAPTYDVLTITQATGTSTAGTFTIAFRYNGFLFQTGTISAVGTGANVVTALLAATGGPNNVALSAYVGSGTVLAGSATTLPVTTTVTASNQLEGPISVVYVDNAANTGGTYTVAESTVGVGAQTPWPAGNVLVLASVYIPSTATSASNYIITNASLPTS